MKLAIFVFVVQDMLYSDEKFTKLKKKIFSVILGVWSDGDKSCEKSPKMMKISVSWADLVVFQ